MKAKFSKRQKALLIGCGLLVATGIYMLYLVFSPALPPELAFSQTKPIDIASVPIDHNKPRVIIPKIGVDIEFFEGTDAVLEKGAWHRFPERGNPETGGNFILSAHRFSIGLTPQQTRAKSPFYNLNKLVAGDPLFVDFNGKRYEYTITRKYTVKPDAVEIEAPSETAKLTLYSCTLKGSHDGREVIEALPVL